MGVYVMFVGNVRFGLVGWYIKGKNLCYLIGVMLVFDFLDFIKLRLVVVNDVNDYLWEDFDFMICWSIGGSSILNICISCSWMKNSLNMLLCDFSGIIGLVGWNW